MASLCLIGWLTLILWPGGQPPLWVVVVVVGIFSVGGPASGIGFMLARDYNPRHRISTATGLVNVGGFCGSVAMVFAVGQILDWVEPGVEAHSLAAFRWALVAIAADDRVRHLPDGDLAAADPGRRAAGGRPRRGSPGGDRRAPLGPAGNPSSPSSGQRRAIGPVGRHPE